MEDKTMLKAKYYNDFKDCENCILIIGDADSYKMAGLHFSRLNGGPLVPSEYISLENTNEINGNNLYLTKKEYSSFSEICSKLGMENRASHDYLTIASMPDIEFLISCGEYKSFP